MWVGFLSQEDPLEEGMATQFLVLPGESPRTEEPRRLQSTESQRVGTQLKQFSTHYLEKLKFKQKIF